MRRVIPVCLALLLVSILVGPSASPAPGEGWRRLDDGRLVKPLRAEPPSWLTPELLAEAKKGPTPAPAAAIPDAPASGFVGIRPGTMMIFPSGCTMNFVFRNGGSLGIGTAGHCAEGGERVTVLTVAPGGSIPVLAEIGSVATRQDSGIGSDYAIVKIDPVYHPWVFPTIAEIGGPCGTYTGSGLVEAGVPRVFAKQNTTLGPQTLFHYGHGLGIGTGGTPRTGVALYWERYAYYWDSPSMLGDSGSPVRIGTLEAAGNLTHLVVDTQRPGAAVAGTRISKMLGSWSLVDSPYCP